MTKYSKLEEMRDHLLTYLKEQKQFLQEDIDASSQLTDDEKIDNGLLIVDATVLRHEDNEYLLGFKVNYTKVRPGDEVTLESSDGQKLIVSVIENELESMTIQYDGVLSLSLSYRISVNNIVMLDPLINLLEGIASGLPGAYFLKLLANIEEPDEEGFTTLDVPTSDSCYARLNHEQQEICKAVLQCPSVYCVQGPPGTGKTDVLGVLARTLAKRRKNVVVIAKTHHAVNNALNKIRKMCANAPISKIGSKLKSDNVDKSICIYEKYFKYQAAYKKRPAYRGRIADVVGMTLQSAIINLGLLHTSFRPSIIFVDEASQLTLAEASVLGVFGASTIVFFGDDKQMPPIFHEKQQSDELSVSIFSHIIHLYPSFEGKLRVTYRMNEDITQCVSSNFYEPFGEKIIASDFSKNRSLQIQGPNLDQRIKKLLSSGSSIETIDVSTTHTWEDSNPEEADFIANLVEHALSLGIDAKDIAVVTPFRRQVLAIRTSLRSKLNSYIPLVDTVERLQGQDVDLVILSFSVTDHEFYRQTMDFLLNRNRLNVMISRAKKKVVIVKSEIIQLGVAIP